MRTFRSLSLLSSCSKSPLVFKSKFPNKKTFHLHFARSGFASLAPVTCRAAVVYGQGKPLQVEQVEVLPPGPGEVRLRLVSASICHTDLWVWQGEDRGMMAPFPIILGHEGAGEVEAIGEGVSGVQVGDPVIPCGLPHCGKCALCLHPRGHGCQTFARADSLATGPVRVRSSTSGKPLHPLMALGTFAEYITVPAAQVAKLPPNSPLDVLSPIGCAVLTGWGAARAVAGVEIGHRVAVWGAGAVGLSTIMGCKDAGATTIVAIDLQQEKLELAKQCGATHTVLAGPDTVAQVMKAAGGRGVDVGFECTGAGQVLGQCTGTLHPGWGEAVLVGCPPLTQKMEVNSSKVIFLDSPGVGAALHPARPQHARKPHGRLEKLTLCHSKACSGLHGEEESQPGCAGHQRDQTGRYQPGIL